MTEFEFASAKSVIWKTGASKCLADYLDQLGIHKPLIVTDQGLIDAGVVEGVTEPLRSAGFEPLIYSGVQADPPEHIVLETIEVAKRNEIDGVVGLGGGSSLDVAKLIAIFTRSKQAIADVYGIDKVRGNRLPLILVPTTAGTGSEVTPISIITTGETTKAGVVSVQLLPDIAVLDAELTTGLPANVTAATGIDAMVHAIEAYTSKIKKNIYSDMLACKALALLSQNIEEAVANGNNIDARGNMLLGSMFAGQAFANAPVAAVHALAYPLGGNYHIPHGLSNSLVLPHVLKFNAPVAAPLYAELLRIVKPELSFGSDTNACNLFIQYIENLIESVGLPTRLADLNIARPDLEMLADDAMEQQRLLVNNPREVSRNDALYIYEAAF